jgi:hypothetical protein
MSAGGLYLRKGMHNKLKTIKRQELFSTILLLYSIYIENPNIRDRDFMFTFEFFVVPAKVSYA